MQQYLPEVFFRSALAAQLQHRGYQVREELLFGNARFDVVAFKGDTIIGYEVKLSSWARAFKQADVYKLCCDFVYIVVPRRKVSDSLKQRCNNHTVGLISIDYPPHWTFEMVVDAPASHRRNTIHHEGIHRIAAFK